jgi:hypothetical protein
LLILRTPLFSVQVVYRIQPGLPLGKARDSVFGPCRFDPPLFYPGPKITSERRDVGLGWMDFADCLLSWNGEPSTHTTVISFLLFYYIQLAVCMAESLKAT